MGNILGPDGLWYDEQTGKLASAPNYTPTNKTTTTTTTTSKESAKGWIREKDNPLYEGKVLGGFTITQKEFAEILDIEFGSFSGKPDVSKAGDFQNLIQGCYNAFVPSAGTPGNFRFIFQERMLTMRPIYDDDIFNVKFSHNGYNYETNLFLGFTKTDIILAWIEPFDRVCPINWNPTTDKGNTTSTSTTTSTTTSTGNTTTQITTQPTIAIATPSAPTTAQNLTYRVGREDDNKDAIKSELLANLVNLPEKPAQKSTPTIQEPTQSFTDYPTTGTRFITLPIKASYTLRLLDRFENEIMAVPYNASQKKIELPINTLGSFYEIMPSKTRFYVHNGKGELLFEDAIKQLDFSRLERFCMPLRDKKHAFVIMEHFLKDLSSYLLGTKKHFDTETIKAIELFLYLFDRNKQRGKDYLECEMIDAIDRALAECGNKG